MLCPITDSGLGRGGPPLCTSVILHPRAGLVCAAAMALRLPSRFNQAPAVRIWLGVFPSPALERMRECAHLMKTEQPRDLGDMQLAVIEVTNRQIALPLLKYFREVQPFVRMPSGKRPFAHSQTAGNVFHEHSSMRKHRRDRILDPGTQLAPVVSSIG